MKLKLLMLILVLLIFTGCSNTDFQFEENQIENQIEENESEKFEEENNLIEDVKTEINEFEKIEINENNDDVEFDYLDFINLDVDGNNIYFKIVSIDDKNTLRLAMYDENKKFLSYTDTNINEDNSFYLENGIYFKIYDFDKVNQVLKLKAGNICNFIYPNNSSRPLELNILKQKYTSFEDCKGLVEYNFNKIEEELCLGKENVFIEGKIKWGNEILFDSEIWCDGNYNDKEDYLDLKISVERLEGDLIYLKSNQNIKIQYVKVKENGNLVCNIIENYYLNEDINLINLEMCDIVEDNVYDVEIYTYQEKFISKSLARSTSEFQEFEFNLEAKIINDKVILEWNEYNELNNFKYYKVVHSTTNSNLKYPEDGYIEYITDINKKNTIDNSNFEKGINYYRITYVLKDGNNIHSNVETIYIVSPEITFSNNDFTFKEKSKVISSNEILSLSCNKDEYVLSGTCSILNGVKISQSPQGDRIANSAIYSTFYSDINVAEKYPNLFACNFINVGSNEIVVNTQILCAKLEDEQNPILRNINDIQSNSRIYTNCNEGEYVLSGTCSILNGEMSHPDNNGNILISSSSNGGGISSYNNEKLPLSFYCSFIDVVENSNKIESNILCSKNDNFKPITRDFSNLVSDEEGEVSFNCNEDEYILSGFCSIADGAGTYRDSFYNLDIATYSLGGYYSDFDSEFYPISFTCPYVNLRNDEIEIKSDLLCIKK